MAEEKRQGWYPVKELNHNKWRVCYYNKGKVVYTLMKDYASFEEAAEVCLERSERVTHP